MRVTFAFLPSFGALQPCSVPGASSGAGPHAALVFLGLEAGIVVLQAAARRGFEVAESFLGTPGENGTQAEWTNGFIGFQMWFPDVPGM